MLNGLAHATWLWLAATSLALAQPVPFDSATVDQSGSGDCKAIGDIDGDGKGDPILGGNRLSWYESGANFTRRTIRSAPVYGEFTTDCQACDLDADGDIDIVLGDGDGENNILWFENPRLNPPTGLGSDPRLAANWTYHEIGSHEETVHDLEVGDLDADGHLEVVTSGHGHTHIWRKSGEVWNHREISSLAGQGVFIGDIDRDGWPDIATPHAWLRNPGDVIQGAWIRFPISGASAGDECLLVDINGDAKLDLITCDAHSRASVYWFEQPANPTSPSWTRRTLDPSMGAHHPEAADFDRDGRADILLGLELSDLAVYLNQGGSPPTFVKEVIAQSGGHNARCGDIDGDSLPDVFACDYITNPPARVHINLFEPPAPCYANCDGSIGEPTLTGNDFACFLAQFAGGNEYANCDASVTEPVLTANDFLCYLNAFVGGCQ
jgi:hypothetical protein